VLKTLIFYGRIDGVPKCCTVEILRGGTMFGNLVWP
jgi:hypothetical protein